MGWIDVGKTLFLHPWHSYGEEYNLIDYDLPAAPDGDGWSQIAWGNPDYPHSYIFTKLKIVFDEGAPVDGEEDHNARLFFPLSAEDLCNVHSGTEEKYETVPYSPEVTIDFAIPFDTDWLAMCENIDGESTALALRTQHLYGISKIEAWVEDAASLFWTGNVGTTEVTI